MATTGQVIPFIKQFGNPGERTCGAACLSMVYGSLGLSVPQEEIWPRISRPNPFGSMASTTHLMARDAIERGFQALVIQAKHPLRALQVCHDRGIRVILNHRLTADSPVGHFSVLAGIEQSDVLLHDPMAGPLRRLNFSELLDLWRAGMPISETIGNVLIGIGPKDEAPAREPCPICKLTVPAEVKCPKCGKPVTLQPAAVLGCVAESCGSRMWSYLCCPECDCTWAFHGKADGPAAGEKGPPTSEDDPLSVDRLFAEIGKAFSHVMSDPVLSKNEEVLKQIELIQEQKEPLRMSLAEAEANRKARRDQLAVMTETAQMNSALHQKRAEEAARESPPLDGDALGIALLRNLGFVR